MNNKVELIGVYGGDYLHALSAWTSTKRELTEDREKRIKEFLKQLADNEHHTPFEKSAIHFLVTTDLASHVHLIKHRINVSVNSESSRYQEQKDKWYVPTDWPEEEKKELEDFIELSHQKYHNCIKSLVSKGFTRSRAKESARYYLPYAKQLTQDVMFNFRSFMHFQKLRNSEHAQLEIRQIAQEMLQLVRETHQFDLSLESFGF
jgi:thymidylate synthase (FAD)